MDEKAWNRLSSEIQSHLKAILDIVKRYEIEQLNMYAITKRNCCTAFYQDDNASYNVDTIKPTIYRRLIR